jgi:hypothetical protein
MGRRLVGRYMLRGLALSYNSVDLLPKSFLLTVFCTLAFVPSW